MIFQWLGRLFGIVRKERRPTDPFLRRAVLDGAEPPSTGVFDSADDLVAELERARRYERAFSVVVLSTYPLGEAPTNGSRAPDTGVRRTIETKMPHVVSLLAAAALREVLRDSDVMCYRSTQNRFVLGLAESDEDDAAGALERIRALFSERLVLGVHGGIARFPDDGLTLGDLIATAEERSRGASRFPEAEISRGVGGFRLAEGSRTDGSTPTRAEPSRSAPSSSGAQNGRRPGVTSEKGRRPERVRSASTGSASTRPARLGEGA